MLYLDESQIVDIQSSDRNNAIEFLIRLRNRDGHCKDPVEGLQVGESIQAPESWKGDGSGRRWNVTTIERIHYQAYNVPETWTVTLEAVMIR